MSLDPPSAAQKLLLDTIYKLRQASSAWTHAANTGAYTPGRQWNLDMLGNWSQLAMDDDQDGPSVADAGDMIEDRVHNSANDLLSQDFDDGYHR